MDKPPWTETPPDEARPAAARASRAFWVTAVVLALVFAAVGVRRERIPVWSVERTDDPLVFIAWPETCNQGARIGVVETAARVTLTATHNRPFCGGVGACAESVQFRLSTPLGERELIDGERQVPLEVVDQNV